jgi:hypothetical protein
MLFIKGGESSSEGLYFTQVSVLAIHAKGEKVLAQRKNTAPPPNFKIFKLVSYCAQNGEKVVFSNLVY